MKLGVFVNHVFEHLTFEEMLDFVKSREIEAVELGTGNYPGDTFVPLNELLMNEMTRKRFLEAIESRGLFISALSCHGNPLHPDRDIAREHHETIIKTIDLAHLTGVPIVNGFSGMPGTPNSSRYPNFPTAPWPPEYKELYEWQWDEVVIPYWQEVGQYARQRGVKLGIEPHGNFSVHSPATLLKLREAVGDVIGVNLDSAHLWWQGIDVVEAIKIFAHAEALYHFSSKDMWFDETNMNYFGLLDMQPFDDTFTRSWTFRTIGYGRDVKTWANMISALKMSGYDYVINIEQDDPLIDGLEGFTKAAQLLKKWII
ncbi:sugar phosphate isomerase/epimerase [Bacillus shivajii]|uniref:sugar phosphate isomerase/epimerase family protein n=1 Tax=Bacillus shivajii TaxID=1983719 RepID=UPI001CF9E7E4|nr:sugar phosphate isomerase/epimerase [Bacillus shivajii]UCZ52109.1 sugar phosphate isomerase/epimerase [Bacillus shivajii]